MKNSHQHNSPSRALLATSALGSEPYPEPWSVGEPLITAGANDRCVLDKEGFVICTLFAPVEDYARIMARDTLAYRIAAVPELLKAASELLNLIMEEGLVTHLQHHEPDTCAICDAQLAISKAEGRAANSDAPNSRSAQDEKN